MSVQSCGQCADGWRCELHPGQPMGHGGCTGSGMPCENPACGYSIKKTGLVCPSGRQAFGEIETQTSRVIRFKCKSCSYHWFAETAHVSDTKH